MSMDQKSQKISLISTHPEQATGWKGRAMRRIGGDQFTVKSRNFVDSSTRAVKRALLGQDSENRHRLTGFRNIHRGETCVIVGNGPSLHDTELRRIHGVPTFGLNRIYLAQDELGIAPTYHVVVNQLVIEQSKQDLLKLPVPLFTTRASEPHLGPQTNVSYLDTLQGPYFSQDVRRGVWEGATVTYVAMQLAFYMGFTRAVLVGVDHKFAVAGPPNAVVESEGEDLSHFSKDYFGKGYRWQLPDLATSETAYQTARSAFERADRSIVDCTVNGSLDVFPKRSLAEEFRD